jgi:hypothetical protein
LRHLRGYGAFQVAADDIGCVVHAKPVRNHNEVTKLVLKGQAKADGPAELPKVMVAGS